MLIWLKLVLTGQQSMCVQIRVGIKVMTIEFRFYRYSIQFQIVAYIDTYQSRVRIRVTNRVYNLDQRLELWIRSDDRIKITTEFRDERKLQTTLYIRFEKAENEELQRL